MSEDEKLPTYERDTGNYAHEWSIPSRSDEPKHYRFFVSIDPEISRIITIEDAQVTSDKPDARRIEGTSRSVSLLPEELEWLIEKGPQILAELRKRWDTISAESTRVESVELGVDGNCAYALVGKDLQTGQAVFVRINEVGSRLEAIRFAAMTAYDRICRRFKKRLPRRFDESYPEEGGARDFDRKGGGSGN